MAASVTTSSSPLGATLVAAIADLRDEAGDVFAPITVVVPSAPNAGLARRALASQGPFIRVWFSTPDDIARAALDPASMPNALRPQPPNWLHASLGPILEDLNAQGVLGRFGATLLSPGWRRPIARAIQKLEREGVTADLLSGVTLQGPEQDRLVILVHTLRRVEGAREEQNIAPPYLVQSRARESLDTHASVGPAAATGAILLGDTELSRATYSFLSHWLRVRPVVRIGLCGHRHLETTKMGIHAAAPTANERKVPSSAAPALRALHDGMFGPTPDSQTDDDASLQLARTPDTSREKTEALREVMRAVRDGTPLARIAVVAPDREHLATLLTDLDRLSLPTTWYVGQPLGELVPARLLRVALDVATNEARTKDVYELLQHQGLSLRHVLAEAGNAGKARWRRLLRKCGYVQGVSRLVQAVDDQLDDAQRAVDPDPEVRERNQRDIVGLRSLQAAVRALDSLARDLSAVGQLHEHARRWMDFLEGWGRASDQRRLLLNALDRLASSIGGPALTLGQAQLELEEFLEQEIPRGRITDAAIKVVAPMQLLGGEFDLVCVLGLYEGSFPSHIREDPLVPDALIEHLNTSPAFQSAGIELQTSKRLADLERRRLAAVIGAATKRLWLSVPAMDFASARPMRPSSLLLDLLSQRLGRRALYRDIDAIARPCGSRAMPTPANSDDALDRAGYMTSRLLVREPGALSALGSHPFARGIMALHRSSNRLRRGLAERDFWTGRIAPDTLPCPGLDGAPLTLGALVQLVRQPGAFFFRRMLQAWGPGRFVLSQPLSSQSVNAAIFAALEANLGTPHDETTLEQKVIDDCASRIVQATRYADPPTPADLDAARFVARRLVHSLLDRYPAVGASAQVPIDGKQLTEAAPFVLEDEGLRQIPAAAGGHILFALERGKAPTKSAFFRDAPALALAGLALSTDRASDEVGTLTKVREESWKLTSVPVQNVAPAVVEALENAASEAAAGIYPLDRDRTFGLVDDDQAGFVSGDADEETL